MKTSKNLALFVLCAFTFPSASVPVICAENAVVAEDSAGSELYQVSPVRFEIPYSALEKAIASNTKVWTSSKFYIEVYRYGKAIWRSEHQEITKGSNSFSFSDKDSFALIAKEEDNIEVKVFIADPESLVRAERAGVGAGGAAVVGAGIGGTITGLLSGGLGVPGGVAIGGAIGALCGGATSQLIPVDGAIEVANFLYTSPSSLFKSKKEEARERGISGAKESVCLAVFRGSPMIDFKKKPGELKQQENYIVRFRKIYLSSADKGVETGKYYLKVTSHDFEQKVDLGKIPQNVEYPIAIEEDKFLVLKNRIGETRLEIYRQIPCWPDKCVFSASQGASDGSTWLFMGRLYEDGKKSWIEAETLGENKK